MFPPAFLAWEAFWKVTLIAPQVASEASKVKGEELDIRQRCYQVYPLYIPTPSRWQNQEGQDGACVCKGQTKSDQEEKAFGVKSFYTPIQSREGPLWQKDGAGRFFSLTDGS